MNKSIQILILCTVFPCWISLVQADTLSVTSSKNMTPGEVGAKKSVTDTLVLTSSDTSFQRDGTDTAQFTYRYRGQASAEGTGSGAGASGYLNFGFSLIPAIWRITTAFTYRGAVAVSSSAGEAGASDLVLSSSGSAAGFSTTLTGAARTTAGGTTFDRTTGIRPPIISTTSTGSGNVRLTFEYGAQCTGAAESYVCLGQTSPLAAFDLDDTWYDSSDGIEMTLIFAPSLNFAGHTADWDLAMVSGETLSGYGTINGDVTCSSGGTIHPTGTGLVIGDSSSSTGFNFGGNVEVTEGDLEIRDYNDAMLLSGSSLTIDNEHVLTVKSLQCNNQVTLNSGMLKVAKKTGAGPINNTGGTLSAHTSPQNIEIYGNYVQGSEGTLLVKIGTPSYDVYYFGENATLAGTLKVELLPGFVPEVGQVFQILYINGNEYGKFTQFDLEPLPAGFFWDTTRLHFYGELRIVADNGGFDFDDSTPDCQGWRLDGAYGDSGIGPLSHSFGLYKLWGALNMYDGNISGNPDDWWIMKLRSPDLTNSTYWQNAVGFQCKLQDVMGQCEEGGWPCARLFANLYVKVFDMDQQIDRYFYSGTAEELSKGGWEQRTFLWGGIPNFPVNCIIRDIFINIWGEEWAMYLLNGEVMLDDVEPIYCIYSADLTGDCHVTMEDLAVLSRQWLDSDWQNCPSADISPYQNCKVDLDDLAVMAEQWGN